VTPVIFFDRDGVLNADIGYLWRKEDFVWMPGAPEAIRLFNQLGWRVVVVTNQSGVARGYYQESDVQSLHAWMNEQLAAQGAHIDSFHFCPHYPQGAQAKYAVECDCRKPGPGMILRGLAEWTADPADCILIGDKESDIAAATAAGIKGYLFEGSNLLDFVRQDIMRNS
jgi:D-glycero-D-manno-heptose 1,7-bisphosphate phosphatase